VLYIEVIKVKNPLKKLVSFVHPDVLLIVLLLTYFSNTFRCPPFCKPQHYKSKETRALIIIMSVSWDDTPVLTSLHSSQAPIILNLMAGIKT
jgi:hypothetical protein